MVQVTVYQNGQYVISDASLMQALGIPATATITSVNRDAGSGQTTIMAQVIQTPAQGTP